MRKDIATKHANLKNFTLVRSFLLTIKLLELTSLKNLDFIRTLHFLNIMQVDRNRVINMRDKWLELKWTICKNFCWLSIFRIIHIIWNKYNWTWITALYYSLGKYFPTITTAYFPHSNSGGTPTRPLTRYA